MPFHYFFTIKDCKDSGNGFELILEKESTKKQIQLVLQEKKDLAFAVNGLLEIFCLEALNFRKKRINPEDYTLGRISRNGKRYCEFSGKENSNEVRRFYEVMEKAGTFR